MLVRYLAHNYNFGDDAYYGGVWIFSRIMHIIVSLILIIIIKSLCNLQCSLVL